MNIPTPCRLKGGDNPQLTAFETLQNVYTKNDNVLFVIAPKDGKVFTAEALSAVEELTNEAWKLPYALRVDAITNFQHTLAEEDDLIVKDLVEDPANQSVDMLFEAQRIALNEPLLMNRIINLGANVTGVNVTLQLPEEDPTEVPTMVAAARLLADQIREENPNLDVYLTGTAMLNNAFQEISVNELSRLLPIMFGLMIVIMIFSLRSATGTLVTMIVVGLATMVAMGVGGFMRVGLTPPSAQAPTIIMTLAIADSIHLLVSFIREMRHGKSKHAAIVESVRLNFMPVFLTSLSTVIGFLTLNFSDVPPFNHLGNITAVGVTAAFLLSVTLLPALMAILPVRIKTREEKTDTPWLDKLADFVILRRKPLLYVSTLIVILFAFLVPRNVLDDRFVEYFDDSVDFRTDTDYTSENLTGIYQVEFTLDSGNPGGISDPDYLQTVDNFAEWYRAQEGVVHVNTFTDVMKRLNKNMHGDDESFYSLPDSRNLAAQYLLLYEMSLPYGLDLNNQINVDKSATRFSVTLENVSSTEIRAFAENGRDWLDQNANVSMHAYGSGIAVMFAYVSGINITSMLKGSAIALILISFMMIFALRSLKLGLISFIPNLLPAIVAFGVWAVLDGVVNIGLSIVIGMTMGIVVDDSIHFMSKYRRARTEGNMDAESAIRYAFSSTGRALVVTTVILVAGFMILSTSAFLMNASMGLMTAITIAIALVIDFFMLPPLLLLLDSGEEGGTTSSDVTDLQPAESSAE